MGKLTTAESYLVNRVNSARQLLQPEGQGINTNTEIASFAILEIMNAFRDIYKHELTNDGTSELEADVDADKIHTRLGISQDLIDDDENVKLGALLLSWVGAAHANTLINLFASMDLREYEGDLDIPEIEGGNEVVEEEFALNSPIEIATTKVQKERKGKRTPTDRRGSAKKEDEKTIEEVLAEVLKALKWSGANLKNHTHYCLDDSSETHIIDLDDHNIRIVVTNKLHGKTRQTYVIPNGTSKEIEDGIVSSKEYWEDYPEYIGIQKYKNHAFKIAQAIKRLIEGEKYDGCITINNESVSDCQSISDDLIKHCDRTFIRNNLEKNLVRPFVTFEEKTSADIYRKSDILKIAAAILGYEGEDALEKLAALKIIEKTDENGVAIFEGEKIIQLGPLTKRLKLQTTGNIAAILRRRRVVAIEGIKVLSDNCGCKIDVFDYESTIRIIREKLHGIDPFTVNVIKGDRSNPKIEIDGATYVVPEIDLYSKINRSNTRSELYKKFHIENDRRHKGDTVVLIKPSGFLRVYPYDETYKAFMRENGLAD